jgi:hypothetical protein
MPGKCKILFLRISLEPNLVLWTAHLLRANSLPGFFSSVHCEWFAVTSVAAI